jgi:hypothetical protein
MLISPNIFFVERQRDLCMSFNMAEDCTSINQLSERADASQIKLFIQLCKLVTSIREHGIIAFEISPAVFFQCPDGGVAMQFKGLSLFPDVCCATMLGRWGFPYLPPETWDPGVGNFWLKEVMDEKAAVWSLGATMYEVYKPFMHSLKSYIESFVNLYAVRIRDDGSERVRSVIEDAMKLSKKDRPSLRDLMFMLQDAEKSLA